MYDLFGREVSAMMNREDIGYGQNPPNELTNMFFLQPLPASGFPVSQQQCANQQVEQEDLSTSEEDDLFHKSTRAATKQSRSFGGQSFPYRLWYLINNDEFREVICWSPDGSYVVFPNENKFLVKVLENPHEKVFKTSSMKSFVRQLNLYGFHKIQLEKERNFLFLRNMDKKNWPQSVFAHVYFKRGREDLLEHVQRRCKVKQLKAESGKQHKKLFSHRGRDDCNIEMSEHYNSRNKGIFFPYHPMTSFQSTNIKDEELIANFPNILPQPQNSNGNESPQETKRKLFFTTTDDNPKDSAQQEQQKPNYSNHPYSMPFPQLLFYPQNYINNCANLLTGPASWSLGGGGSGTNNGQQQSGTTSSASPTTVDNLQKKKNTIASPSTTPKVKSENKLPDKTGISATPTASPSEQRKDNNAKLNLSPLAVFCASLFRPNGGKIVANCE